MQPDTAAAAAAAVAAAAATAAQLQAATAAAHASWQQWFAAETADMVSTAAYAALAAFVAVKQRVAAMLGRGQQAPADEQQQQQQQLQLLRLRSFSSDLPWSAAMLAALPVHSLTCLHMDFLHSFIDADTLSDALGQLSNLRQLRLSLDMYEAYLPTACVMGVTKLSQLTSLYLEGQWREVDVLIDSLSEAGVPLHELRVALMRPRRAGSPQDLSRLTQLETLQASWVWPRGCILPVQLRHLEICEADMAEVSAVLAPLQQLTHLTLRQPYMPCVHVTQPQQPWTQLRELCVFFDSNLEARCAVNAAVAACTQLTKLQLVVYEPHTSHILTEPVDEWPGSAAQEDTCACRSVAGLAMLRDLSIKGHWCEMPGEALALTALTGLIRLALPYADRAVGTEAAIALACSLQQLEHLNLVGCSIDLSRAECLAAIGQLTRLTELRLYGNLGIVEEELMQLPVVKGLPKPELVLEYPMSGWVQIVDVTET